MKKQTWTFFGCRAIILVMIGWAVSCANYSTAPTGGPKDLAPPVLVKADPPQGTVGFTHDKITLAFDEFVVLQNTDKIIVSPPLEKISYSSNLKTVTVLIEDSLAEGETYSINFRNAVGDLHESTPLRDFTYVFSTGKTIDSGFLSGILLDAFDNKPVKEASVLLYAQMPSGYPSFPPPDYVSTTDEEGFFTFSHIKEGCYHVLAIAEESRDYQLNPVEEKMAFPQDCWQTQAFQAPVLFTKAARQKESDTALRAAYDTALQRARRTAFGAAEEHNHRLFLYQDWQEDVFLKEAKWNARGEILLMWHYRPDSSSLRYEFLPSYADEEMVAQAQKDTDTVSDEGRRDRRSRRVSGSLAVDTADLPDLTWPSRLRMLEIAQDDPLQTKLWFDNYAVDDLRLVLHNGAYADTVELTLPTAAARSKDTAAFRVSAQAAALLHTDSLVLAFTLPIEKTDLEQARLYQYSTDEEERRDTAEIPMRNMRVERIHPQRISLSYAWKQGASYQLFLPSSCFSDPFGRLTDTTFLRFSVSDPLNFGQVAVTLSGLEEGKNYVLQMVGASSAYKTVLFQRSLKGGEGDSGVDGKRVQMVEFPYVKPGSVTFVLFEDLNDDARWNAGHYPSRLQPERRYYFPKTLQVEADWRIEEIWNIE